MKKVVLNWNMIEQRWMYICCLFMCLEVNCLYAQEETIYRTKQLEEIGQMLETRGISAMKPGIYDADAICPGKRVRVEAGFGGLISSIGLELFDTRVVAEYLRPVYDFVERYLLRLLLIDKPDEILRLLNDDKVGLVLNGVPFEKSPVALVSFVAAIQPGTDFVFVADTTAYKVGWDTGTGTLQMTFPKQYGLIAGKDKIEMEDDFQKELFLYMPETPAVEQVPLSVLTAVPGCGYYRRRGEHYIIPALCSDRYYRVAPDSVVTLLFDKDCPEASLANLFLEGERIGQEVFMEVEHRRYGKRRDHLELPVNSWVAFCKGEKCVPYFGVEEIARGKVTGTVIMVNSDLGYHHVLYYECDRQKFLKGDYSLKGWLYTYVPTHNVLDLFEEYKSKVKKLNY